MRARRALVALGLVVILAPTARAPAARAQEQGTTVAGGGDPASAPRLPGGLYVDLIREPETLWYAVEAARGQTVSAVVVVRGRQDGPATQRSALTVEVLDAQRQPSGEAASQPFTGTADVQVQVTGAPLPTIVDEDVAYLTLTLASPEGANDLRDFGYRVEFLVQVAGTPLAAAPPASATAQVAPTTLARAPDAPPPPAGVGLGQVLPVALFGLAAGAALGFEVTRKRLRSYR